MKPYQVGKGQPSQTQKVLEDKNFNARYQITDGYLRLLSAKHVKRYNLKWGGDWINYGVHLAEPRDINLFSGERILLQRIVSGKRLDGTCTNEVFICNTDVITLKLKAEVDKSISLNYFAGILMSSLCAYYVKSRNINLDRAAFPKINTNTLLNFPIRAIDMNNPADMERHAKMVSLVEQMLSLNVKLAAADSTSRTVLQRQIETTDAQIDRLVYALYGLSPEEIAIVEAAG